MAIFFALILFNVLVYVDLFIACFKGVGFFNSLFHRFCEAFAIVISPWAFLFFMDIGQGNDCCGDSAVFAPHHKLVIYTLIIFCTAAYVFASLRKKIASPIIETLVNILLLVGIVLNIFIALQVNTHGEFLFLIIGNAPIVLLFFAVLVKNYKILKLHFETDYQSDSRFEKLAIKILLANPLIQYPLLLIVALPVLIIIGSLLLIFGQKPDSFIRAFTQTYHYGFSQLNYMCDNVQCGGHYLCSVAAKGHPVIVKPIRTGERNKNMIICNRQLLISNAFEEMLEERLPRLHKLIRKKYNRVGNFIHRYYQIFNNRYFSDAIYFLMKPLELLFVLILYTFDKKPENRIARQYLTAEDKEKIRNK